MASKTAKGETRRDRFASPLVFSAWPEARGNRTLYRPVVLLLPTHNQLRKRGLKLKTSPTTSLPISVGSWWPADEVQRRAVMPRQLQQFAGKSGDVLLAFVLWFQQGAPK